MFLTVSKTNLAVHEDKNRVPYVKVKALLPIMEKKYHFNYLIQMLFEFVCDHIYFLFKICMSPFCKHNQGDLTLRTQGSHWKQIVKYAQGRIDPELQKSKP